MSRPEVKTSGMTVSDLSEKVKKKNLPSTPFKMLTKTKRILQNEVVNTKKSQKGVVEENFILHENLLGEELCPHWTDLVRKLVSWKVGKIRRVIHRRSIVDILGQLLS